MFREGACPTGASADAAWAVVAGDYAKWLCRSTCWAAAKESMSATGLNLVNKARIIDQWKAKTRQLKTETYALSLAYRHPKVPWYAKVFAACVVGYLFSPIDLIPDFIPVLGYLDDLILVPLGIVLALKMIPKPVWEECREEAQKTLSQDNPRNWTVAGFIIAIWLLLIALVIVFIAGMING